MAMAIHVTLTVTCIQKAEYGSMCTIDNTMCVCVCVCATNMQVTLGGEGELRAKGMQISRLVVVYL
jgi:hypothetical protein